MVELTAELLRRFHDEDTDIWIQAAREIGGSGSSGLEFIRSVICVRENLHAHRHIWCALGVYLTESDDNPSLRILIDGQSNRAKEVPVRCYLMEWLTNILITGLSESNLTIGDFGSSAIIDDRRKKKIDALISRRDTVKNIPEKGLREIARQMELLQRDDTPIAAVARDLLHAAYPVWDPWILASFMAGASMRLIETIGIPIDRLIQACSALATRNKGNIAYIASIPRFLNHHPVEPESGRRIAAVLLQHLPEPTAQESHWVEYLSQLSEWLNRVQLNGSETIAEHIAERLSPVDLKRAYREWCVKRNERAAIDLIRITRGQFCGLDEWKEKPDEEQMALGVFLQVMERPCASDSHCQVLTLPHRIRILRTAIETWMDSNRIILISLVRLLKHLLHEQIQAIAPRSNPDSLLRSQIYLIQPLVERWNLRGTVDKDLATIAARVLTVAYRFSGYRDTNECIYRELLYTLLYALPEKKMIQDLISYTFDDEIRDHLKQLSDAIACIHSAVNDDCVDAPFSTYLEAIWPDPASSKTDQPGAASGEPDRLDPAPQEAKRRERGNAVSSMPDRSDIHALIDVLRRADSGKGLTHSSRKTLHWFIYIRERWLLEAKEDTGEHQSKDYETEKQNEIEMRVEKTVTRFDSLIKDIVWQEQIVAGSSLSPVQYIHALNDLFQNITHLRELCRQFLPFPEREYINHCLRVARQRIQQRITLLGPVFEEQREASGLTLLADPKREEITTNDRVFIQNWMLKRFMLSELAPPRSMIKVLLDWRCVALWILVPFLLAGVLAHAGSCGKLQALQIDQAAGYPFLLTI
ncbi:hypothetical protein JXA80_13250, partial [bacterium]|nr:hypothetical protein [candidate division CSSED10-310 bacterium]